jgi:hypothetical protein
LQRLVLRTVPLHVKSQRDAAQAAGDVNGVHPGVVRTNFGLADPGPGTRLLSPLVRPSCSFARRRAGRSSRRSYDPGARRAPLARQRGAGRAAAARVGTGGGEGPDANGTLRRLVSPWAVVGSARLSPPPRAFPNRMLLSRRSAGSGRLPQQGKGP